MGWGHDRQFMDKGVEPHVRIFNNKKKPVTYNHIVYLLVTPA